LAKSKIVLPKVGPFFEDTEAGARVDRVLNKLTSDLTDYDAQSVGGVSGSQISGVVQSLFFQPFEANVDGSWDFFDGSKNDVSYTTNGKAGGRALRVSSEVQMVFPENIVFDPDRRYRIRTRIRRISGSGSELAVVGVHGIGSDGSTRVDRSGGTDPDTMHAVAASVDPSGLTADVWTLYTGYFQGVSGTGDATSPSTVPSSPRVLHDDVRYIRPHLHLNVGGGTNVLEVDYIALDIMPERSEVDDLLEQVDGRDKSDVSSTIRSGGTVADDQVPTGAIQANAVVASKISVGTLSAIAANIGTITAGILQGSNLTIDLDATGSEDVLNLASGTFAVTALGGIKFNADLEHLNNWTIGNTRESSGGGGPLNPGMRVTDDASSVDLWDISLNRLIFGFMPTERLTLLDSGETGATNDAWIEHEINGTTYYARLHTTK